MHRPSFLHLAALLGLAALSDAAKGPLVLKAPGCNPMDSKQYPCPLLNGIDNPSTLKSEFTAAKEIASPGWHLENDEEAPVRYSQSWVEGAVFTIGKRGDKPTIETDEYIWYGRVDVDMKVAVGQGIVSAVTIISDTKDEISWVTVGSDSHIARSNYVGKGNTATGERDKIHTVSFPGAQPAFHRYSIDWRHDRINWEINNQVMRTLMFEDTVTKNEFPQTPSKVRIGMWTLDDPDHQTRSAVELASGQTTYTTDGGMPWNMYVRRVEIVNYNASRHYNFTGRSRSADEVATYPHLNESQSEHYNEHINPPNDTKPTGPSKEDEIEAFHREHAGHSPDQEIREGLLIPPGYAPKSAATLLSGLSLEGHVFCLVAFSCLMWAL